MISRFLKIKDDASFDGRLTIKRLIAYLFRRRRIMILAIGAMIVTALFESSFIWLVNTIVNEGFIRADTWFLKWVSLVLFVVVVLRAVTGYFANFYAGSLSRYLIFEIRKDTFASLITLPTAYFDKNTSAQNVSKLIYDAEVAAVASTDTLTVLFKDTVLVIALFATLFYLDWRLTLIFILAIPLMVSVTIYASKRFRKTSKEIQDSMGGIANTVKEASIGQKVIKVFSGQSQELENFDRANDYNLARHIKRMRVSAAVVPVTMLILAPVLALILHVYLNYFREGIDSAGDFVSYFGACMMLTSPLKKLAKINEKVQVGLTAAHSVFKVMDAPPEPDSGTKNIGRSNGRICFENVSFNYVGLEGGLVLKNMSFEIPAGKRVALVGPSGSGKSTITALLMRLYEPQTGVISLDGDNIQNLTLADLRAQFALVSQETTLFDDTVSRNIMYGMLDQFDEKKLQQAISSSYVKEFVADLPDGLETIVGEHGLRLSGGQRQRIAIARAVYKDAPILILDEATSALDNKSEKYVQDALEALMENRTSLVIAHRLSTIENADAILVLDQGKIVEQGSHRQLLRKNGMYAQLHAAQSKKPARKRFFF